MTRIDAPQVTALCEGGDREISPQVTALREGGDRESKASSLALYVHWPYCARICPYCDFNVVRDRGRVEEQGSLVEAIVADMEAQSRLTGPRRLASIFFGGGTPSLMAPVAVEQIIARAYDLFRVDGPIEITLEANPTDAEAGRYAALAVAGINRLSMGVQSFQNEALRFLGRDHSAQEARAAIATASAIFPRLSIDLIYARPDQSVAQWTEELTTAMDLGFEHISPYQLTLEGTTAFGRAYARGQLIPPNEDLAAELYEATQSVLEQAGFEAYEVSNHARTPAARSSHNLHVWRGGDYLGLGPGAHGRITTDQGRMATVAHRRIADYVAGVAAQSPWGEHEVLDAASSNEELVLLGLRTTEGVALSLLEAMRLSATSAPLSDLMLDGFVGLSDGRIAATAKGRPVLDAILRALLT